MAISPALIRAAAAPRFYEELTMSPNLLTGIAVGAVCCYYIVMWSIEGRDPQRGTIVIQYEPPASLSPSMLRYVWKETFDDRTFWAGVLSLVAKGLATLEMQGDAPRVRAIPGTNHKPELPREERFLLDKILQRCGPKGMSTKLFDEETGYQAWGMATVLRQGAVGRWFVENRESVIGGAVLSLLPVYFSAQAHHLDQVLVLAWALALMAPGGFYLIALLPHFGDLIRASRKGPRPAVLWRALRLLALVVPCVAGLGAGALVLGVNFGLQVLLVAALMVGLDIAFLHLMRAPTAEGRKLLDEIEGFRQFLSSVEKSPMDRLDVPSGTPSLYERYLPCAVALEVEQAWSDKFLAMAESLPEWEFWEGNFCLGTWNGEPVGISLHRKPRHLERVQ
jgi:hypothetical protein